MAEIQPKMPPFTWLDSMMSVCYSVSEREVTLIPGIKGYNAGLKLHFVSLNLVFKSYAEVLPDSAKQMRHNHAIQM